MKWHLLLLIWVYYSALGYIYHGDIYRIGRYFLSILFAFLFYMVGFNLFFLRERTFLRVSSIILVCISILGIIQGIGILFNEQLLDFINRLREVILAQVLDRERLTLLFSEPSFLASYLLVLYFLSERYVAYRFKFGYLLKFIIVAAAILSLSVYVYIVLSTLLFFKIFCIKSIRKRLIYALLFFCIIGSFIVMDIDRFASLINAQDMSALIRFLYIEALLNMAVDTYLIGAGIGSFGYYFPKFLSGEYIVPGELHQYLNGENLAVPFSLFFQFVGETGMLGASVFLWLVFSGFKKSKYKPYYIAAFISTLSALPWGLPYFWFLIGYLHRLVYEGR
ncbi:MAG: hypothetical protein GXO18_05515 [Aquificae bacterium]|nr:hypothetical protein [Aquificota bacterium]